MNWEPDKRNAINRAEMIFCDGKTANEITLHLRTLWLKQMHMVSCVIEQHYLQGNAVFLWLSLLASVTRTYEWWYMRMLKMHNWWSTDCRKVAQFDMLQRLLNSSRDRVALGAQWGTDRDCITPCKTLKHTYYEETGGCEMWKLHQMDATTENHHTSYSVPAGHPLIPCVCFSTLLERRGKEHNKNSCICWVLNTWKKIQYIYI